MPEKTPPRQIVSRRRKAPTCQGLQRKFFRWLSLCITHCVLQLVYYTLCITPWVKLRKEKRSWIPSPSPCLLCEHVECMSQSLSNFAPFSEQVTAIKSSFKKLRFFVYYNRLSSFPSLETRPENKSKF